MPKRSVFAGLGDYYSQSHTGYPALPFIYKNISDFSGELKNRNWENTTPMIDDTAKKEMITLKLKEVIDSSSPEDWLLFYFTGHANKYFLPEEEKAKTYCVTNSPDLTTDFRPGLEQFFSEIDYNAIIDSFGNNVPGGHLITVLDCCFAAGIVETFSTPTPFHTIIAASSAQTKAAYTDNSLFFKAFTKYWASPFNQLKTQVQRAMMTLQAPNTCQVMVASNFQNATL